MADGNAPSIHFKFNFSGNVNDCIRAEREREREEAPGPLPISFRSSRRLSRDLWSKLTSLSFSQIKTLFLERCSRRRINILLARHFIPLIARNSQLNLLDSIKLIKMKAERKKKKRRIKCEPYTLLLLLLLASSFLSEEDGDDDVGQKITGFFFLLNLLGSRRNGTYFQGIFTVDVGPVSVTLRPGAFRATSVSVSVVYYSCAMLHLIVHCCDTNSLSLIFLQLHSLWFRWRGTSGRVTVYILPGSIRQNDSIDF